VLAFSMALLIAKAVEVVAVIVLSSSNIYK